jgi:putative tryptophan/tyrosine transport system substrate-binding protein
LADDQEIFNVGGRRAIAESGEGFHRRPAAYRGARRDALPNLGNAALATIRCGRMPSRSLGKLALALGLGLSILNAALAPDAQESRAGKIARIGRLSPLSAEVDAPNIEAFRRGMREAGWVEGSQFTIESRFADGKREQLMALATELVRQRVDLVLTGSSAGALAAKKATDTIPIVIVTTGDPVGDGIVASLAHPGGNVTGVTALGQALNLKRLELLKEAVPGLMRVAVLVNPASFYTTTYKATFNQEKQAAMRTLGLDLRVFEARHPADLDRAFPAMTADRVGALMVQTDALFITHQKRIVTLAAQRRLPAIYGGRDYVDAGGLMFYGATLAGMYREAAGYADKILKGTKPADLPVEQATTLDLVINLKTAKALGMAIPPALLVRASDILDR